MIVFLAILVYLLIGLIGVSLIHRYFEKVDSGEFIYLVALWPFVITIVIVFGGLSLLENYSKKYLELIGKRDES